MTEEIIAKITEALRTNPELKHRAEIAYRFLLDPQARVVSQGALDLVLNQPWQDKSHEDSFKANIKSWMPRDPDAAEAVQIGRVDAKHCARWERLVVRRKPNHYQRVMINTSRTIAYLVPRIRKTNGGVGYKAVGIPQSQAGLFEATVWPLQMLLVHNVAIAQIGVEDVPNWPGSKRLVGDADVLLGQWEYNEKVWDLNRYLEHVRTHTRDDQPWNL